MHFRDAAKHNHGQTAESEVARGDAPIRKPSKICGCEYARCVQVHLEARVLAEDEQDDEKEVCMMRGYGGKCGGRCGRRH